MNLIMATGKMLAWTLEHRNLEELWSDDSLPSTQQPLTERVAFIADVAEKLSVLHKIGLVHGDLKPSNIFVHNGDGKARLGGLAHALIKLDATAQHDDETVIQLPSLQEVDWRRRRPSSDFHRAPELGQATSVDEKTDIYALGVVLYRMAVGNITAPFSANWQETVPVSYTHLTLPTIYSV